MKRKMTICCMLLMMTLGVNVVYAGLWDDIIGGIGQIRCNNPENCDVEKECLESLGIKTPYFYCDCKTASTPFSYGTDMIVNDTLWFTAKLADIKQGLTAYWFANGAVHFDIFPTCTSDTSILSITIGKNSAYNMSPDFINTKLESLGGLGNIAEQMSVNIRVAPVGSNTTGRAIFTSFNEGHHSVCEYPMPVLYNLPYVLSETDNHYLLAPAKPKALAVQWIQTKKEPVRIEVTKGSCATTDLVASAVLTDSTKVWIPDMAMLQNAYETQDSLYFHFYTEENVVGRVYFVAPYKAIEYQVDTTLCQGFGLHMTDTSFYASTTYMDTFYISQSDSILFTTYNLTVTEPEVEYDTLTVTSDEFPFIYKEQTMVSKYGNFTVTIRKEGECDKEIKLHVKAPIPSSLMDGENGFNIMPTMAKRGEEIRVNGPEGAHLQVYSLLGEEVMNMTLQQNNNSFSLPIAGHYVARITTQKAQAQTRIFIK